MIKIEIIGPGMLKILVPETLKADDFLTLAPEVEAIIKQFSRIRLLVDASRLEGWDNFAALEKHAAFVKDHQGSVERIAVVARHDWQHWLVGAVKVFLHPEVKAFDIGHEAEALRWMTKLTAKGDGEIVSTAVGEPIERLVADIADRA